MVLYFTIAVVSPTILPQLPSTSSPRGRGPADVGRHDGEGGGDVHVEARGRLGRRLAVQVDDKALSRVLRNRGQEHGLGGMGMGMRMR